MIIFLLILQFIKTIFSWPLITIATVITFRKDISGFLNKIMELKLGDFSVSTKTYSQSLEMPEISSIKEEEKDESPVISDKKQSENIPEKPDENKTAELQSSLNLIKHFIFNEIYFNYNEIIGYIDKLLGMWPFFMKKQDLDAMYPEQKVNLLVSKNKLDSNAGRDAVNLYSYWLNNKDKINLIEDKDELLKNYYTTKQLIIYLKSLT